MEMELNTPNDSRCRVCLNVTKHALYLQEHISGRVEAPSYMEVLMLCCNVKISLGDGKPKKICLECMENAIVSYNFKICCERSNSILENEVCISTSHDMVGKIKLEDDPDLDKTTIPDSNLVQPPTVKCKEEIIPKLDGDVQKTITNHATDSQETTISDIHFVELPVVKYEVDIPELDRDTLDTVPNYHIPDSDQISAASKNDVQNYTCKCGKTYLYHSNLKLHMKTCALTDDVSIEFGEHIEQNQSIQTEVFVCKCTKVFETRRQHSKHIKKCNYKLHKCSTCGLKCKSFGTLSMHIRKNHIVVGKCSYCDTILDTYKSLIAHTKEHHTDKLDENILCDICGAVFDFPNLLRKHRDKLHKILHECKLCDFSIKYYEGFLVHMRDKHSVVEIVDGKEFSKCAGIIRKCEYCDYTATGYIKLGKHMEVEHEDKKTVVCDQCGMKFFTHRRLLAHRINRHRNSNKKLICEVCGKQVTNSENLKRHMHIHTGERPFKCKFCPKAFCQSSTLTIHIKHTHSEERNAKCDVCGKCFKSKSNLNIHNKRNHARQLNYKCSVCDKAFFNKRELNLHSIVHTRLRMFHCEVCKRGFGRREHLKTHMRTHTGEKPHVCHVCGKGFSQTHCLRTHLLKHTDAENETIFKM